MASASLMRSAMSDCSSRVCVMRTVPRCYARGLDLSLQCSDAALSNLVQIDVDFLLDDGAYDLFGHDPFELVIGIRIGIAALKRHHEGYVAGRLLHELGVVAIGVAPEQASRPAKKAGRRG